MPVPDEQDIVSVIRPHELAEQIAADLMTNGSGDTANRLVLESVDGKDLGGWSMIGLIFRITKHLTGDLNSPETEASQ